MTLVEYLEEWVTSFRNINDSTRVLTVLLTVVGFLVVTFYALRFTNALVQSFRLYVWSQFCCSNNTLKYGEWVVVTGATDGIGQSMAKEYARRGHSILAVGRSVEKLARTKDLLESEPNVGRVETIQIDLSDSSLENYERIKKQLDADNRDIGILVNNAGVANSRVGRYAKHDMETIKNIVNVNVLAPAYLTRIILPGMLARRRGMILNVSSLAGETQAGLTSVYGPSKSFLNSLSRTLQLDYSSHPIDIINLTPGFVYTKLMSVPSGVKGSNMFVPTTDGYARTAINATTTKPSSLTGCLVHDLSRLSMVSLDRVGILSGLFLMVARWRRTTHRSAADKTRS